MPGDPWAVARKLKQARELPDSAESGLLLVGVRVALAHSW